ncbi:MAG: hypothetical protein CBB96_05560 [Gammaproteobacteria bacterium TMED36]|nr:MAG: hypothetical protein CBB96_08920 [Gammaproteobacteria bacterium TMED36]OUT94630.1 MAG: hypothetical protein CBB96_05560 [Gammaproteobacteria bacterium TMED36]|tara:strand:+ start:17726 stop:19492 length:1767 start_codon:yes stop_codon:yes gene_type:complete
MAFSESPAITVREIDLSGVVPSVSSSTGAIAGNFSWGPVLKPIKVDNEATLVDRFGTPDTTNTFDFHSAAYFLKYTNALQVVRVVDSNGKNAYNGFRSGFGGGNAPLIRDLDHFNTISAAQDSDGRNFIAKYAGALGNSLEIQICPFSTGDSDFDTWSYRGNFDAAPGTSEFATKAKASNDEVHVAVLDKNGAFTGTKNTVLETFSFLSLGSNAKSNDGTSNYIKDVINSRSEYVWHAGFDSDFSKAIAGSKAAAGTQIDSGDNFALQASLMDVHSYKLDSGANSTFVGTGGLGKFLEGYTKFNDKDTIQVDFLIAPRASTRTSSTTVTNNLVAIAQTTRKDCVVVTSPPVADVITTTSPVTNTVAAANTYTSSSYLIVDNNFLKIYDKYNDQYIFIPAASSTAGIMANTDFVAAPWFSPAGPRRGQYLGITALAYTPTKSERDTLYKAGINPIANLPGQGVLLFGDKTKLARPSAFDRINVRRLFLVIERAIALAARNVMFEFNDEFTRAEFVGVVEPFLREIKGRRGITDFRVVCDETNNTAAVIDRNEFIANILIKPARSINFVTLNFVAVRTGVDFEEIAGIGF